MANPTPGPERDPGTGGTRPMSRRNSRIFVTGAILFALLFALFTIYMVTKTADDPDIQQGIEEFRRDTGRQ